MRQSIVLTGVLVGAFTLSGVGYYAATRHAPAAAWAPAAAVDPVVTENEADISAAVEEIPAPLAVDNR